ncbi:hypothetical protein ACEWY4_000567 [Coilia grayii]|uniref:Phosphotransferase n=1 Tax=Coilia grayii TaxID=363190 RepID=A0ABD1KX18_9TELE
MSRAVTEGASEDDARSQVEDVLLPFDLPLEKLCEVSKRLDENLTKGLTKETHDKASVKMLPTFVRDTPDGTENGDFLALDLGGTNVRVLHVRVEENLQNLLYKKPIPEYIKKGKVEELFNYIADVLAESLKELELKEKVLPLGFSCSFPCEQKDIDKANLIRWTKGFACSGGVGCDVVKLLKEAIKRKEESEEHNLFQVYKIQPVAILNDTVGTMMSCPYKDQSCEIGLIIGTGTNACYMEEMRDVKRVEGDEGRMCINTEWGGFGDGDDGSLQDVRTEFDKKVDLSSSNQGVHTFEKMISGMYLGELARLVLIEMTEKNLLFGGKGSKALSTPYSFKTPFISEIEKENTGLKRAQEILKDLGLSAKQKDCEIVQQVCETISTRSAQLCGAALAAVANRIRNNRGLSHFSTTVGVDGAVYAQHPHYSDRLQKTVQKLAPNCTITFVKTEDGSGNGAAMAAAVVKRLKRKKSTSSFLK